MNIFVQFIKSIYSPKDIASFRSQKMGKTILYVFLLTLLSILPSAIYFSTALSSGIDTARTFIKDETPDFSIKNGLLSAKTDVPVTITKDDFTFFLDPSGAISDIDVAEEGTAFALLKDEFVVSAGGQSDSYPYSMIEGLEITKEDLVNFIDQADSLKGAMISILAVFIYIFSSASSFIEISFVALIGVLLMNLTGRKLNYGQLWRMAAYSETLPTVFFTIMAALKTNVPNSFVINWFVVLMVLTLAINETPKPSKEA